MGNTCETMCCGCFPMPIKVNDSFTTKKPLLSYQEPIYEMPRSSSIFTIYSPIDYEPVLSIFDNETQKKQQQQNYTNTSTHEVEEEDISISSVSTTTTTTTPTDMIELTPTGSISINNMIEKYLKQAFRTIFPSIAFKSTTHTTNLQFFQCDTDYVKTDNTNTQCGVLSNVLTYFKTILTKPKPITNNRQLQLSPLSVFLLRINDFNFL